MSKRKLELIEAVRTHDQKISDCRVWLDGHARGRRYKELAQVAKALESAARNALTDYTELNAILDAEWQERRR